MTTPTWKPILEDPPEEGQQAVFLVDGKPYTGMIGEPGLFLDTHHPWSVEEVTKLVTHWHEIYIDPTVPEGVSV